MESTGVLYWLKKKITKSIENEKIDSPDKFLKRGMFGFKNVENMKNALNCLTAIEKIDEDNEGYFTYYKKLSEYSHPNFSGTIGTFSRTDQDTLTIKFGSYIVKNDWDFILKPLYFSCNCDKFSP